MMFITNLISEVERGGSEEAPETYFLYVEDANAAANKVIRRRSSLLNIFRGLFYTLANKIQLLLGHFNRYAHNQCAS